MSADHAIDLRLGRWQDVLADVECDALICDPPYSARTHDGWNAGEEQVRDATGQSTRQALSYEAWTPDDVREFVISWSPRVRGWMCCMTDDVLLPAYRATYLDAGRYPFAAVPVIQPRPRLLGDGPANWAVYLMVARPRNREFAAWGCLPGMYLSKVISVGGICGAKPVALMRRIVDDYSREGDLIADPCAGRGSTLMAARACGRRAVGAEVDAGRIGVARDSISNGPLFA